MPHTVQAPSAWEAVFAVFRNLEATITLRTMLFEETGLREFVRLWAEEFHETISLDEASRCAASLLNLMRTLATVQSNESASHEIFPLLP